MKKFLEVTKQGNAWRLLERPYEDDLTPHNYADVKGSGPDKTWAEKTAEENNLIWVSDTLAMDPAVAPHEA